MNKKEREKFGHSEILYYLCTQLKKSNARQVA